MAVSAINMFSHGSAAVHTEAPETNVSMKLPSLICQLPIYRMNK
jgi:hypothetical protein